MRRRLGPGATRRGLALAATLFLATGLAGCDDQIKYVPWFETMTDQPSIETYQEEPIAPPEGTVPVDATHRYDLLEADTVLLNPLEPSPENAARGKVQYERFCLPCHGDTGEGNGPVISSEQNPGRLPPLPTANLLSQRARGLSDGYIWGMIENGRGLMPAYSRVPHEERWYLVEYVRELQRSSPGDLNPQEVRQNALSLRSW
ncbi:MAG: c-type cytochrome [Gemmatimonadota bacterium]